MNTLAKPQQTNLMNVHSKYVCAADFFVEIKHIVQSERKVATPLIGEVQMGDPIVVVHPHNDSVAV